jgi:hypothetical protein
MIAPYEMRDLACVVSSGVLRLEARGRISTRTERKRKPYVRRACDRARVSYVTDFRPGRPGRGAHSVTP